MKSIAKTAAENSRTQKTCSRCQASFTCRAAQKDERCWCEDLPPAPLVVEETADCFCPACLENGIGGLRQAAFENQPELREGEDYYFEGGAFVFTRSYHLRRGYCCNRGCRHCPYGKNPIVTA